MPEYPRLAWVDASRAFAIVAIVLMHTMIWFLAPTGRAHADMEGWQSVTSMVGAFRLPVLFALSGFLMSSRIRSGWGERRNLVRAASSYYLYVVWLAIFAIITFIVHTPLPQGVSPTGFFKQLLLPATPLWFVFFLAVNVVIFTTLARVHPALVMSAAIVVAIISLKVALPSDFAMIDRGIYYFFLFGLGVYGKEILSRFVATGLVWRVPLMLAVSVTMIDVVRRMPGSASGYVGALMLRDVAAVFCITVVMAAVCHWAPAARALGFIGKRTLPVYVMHVPLIWAAILVRNAVFGETIDTAWVRLLAPVVVLVGIFAVSIAVYALAKRSRISQALFEMPPAIGQRILSR